MRNIKCQRSSLARRSKLRSTGRLAKSLGFRDLHSAFADTRTSSAASYCNGAMAVFPHWTWNERRVDRVVIVASLFSTCIVFFIQTFMSYLCFGRMTNLLNESLHAYVSEEKSKQSAKQAHPGSSNIFLLWLEPTVAHLLRNFSLESYCPKMWLRSINGYFNRLIRLVEQYTKSSNLTRKRWNS